MLFCKWVYKKKKSPHHTIHIHFNISIFHAHPSLFFFKNMSFPPHEHTYREGEWEVMCMKACEDWLRWVSSRNDPRTRAIAWLSAVSLSYPRSYKWNAFLSGLACVNLLYRLYKEKGKITVSAWDTPGSEAFMHPFSAVQLSKQERGGFGLIYHIEVSLNKVLQQLA